MVTAKKATAPAKKVAAKKVAAKTAPAKKAPATTTAAKKVAAAPAAGRNMTIRMYNVGFGDAFLVKIPRKKGELRILFDCGSIEASPAGGKMANIVKNIISDVTDDDGVARIDVVVATHRHKDHVSGFGDDAWNAIEVKEVWMPWTEHPTDPEARRIREAQSKLALGLSMGLAAAPEAVGAAAQRDRDIAADVVANALVLSNEAAMTTLHNGFTGEPLRRFLPLKGDAGRSVDTDVLPGVVVHVLGPSRDADVIRDMDPPKGESYLRMRGVALNSNGLPPAPFASEYRMQSSKGAWTLTPQDMIMLQNAGGSSDLAVAVALDKAVNGTSLMLILEVAGTVLLFPGDAQWGTWMAVLEDPQWRELLQRVNFYKIGHHGSHNASPKKFVRDLLPVGCCAMASTLVRKVWPDIPKQQLLAGLVTKKAAIARSDEPTKVTGTAFKAGPGVIEATIPF